MLIYLLCFFLLWNIECYKTACYPGLQDYFIETGWSSYIFVVGVHDILLLIIKPVTITSAKVHFQFKKNIFGLNLFFRLKICRSPWAIRFNRMRQTLARCSGFVPGGGRQPRFGHNQTSGIMGNIGQGRHYDPTRHMTLEQMRRKAIVYQDVYLDG